MAGFRSDQAFQICIASSPTPRSHTLVDVKSRFSCSFESRGFPASFRDCRDCAFVHVWAAHVVRRTVCDIIGGISTAGGRGVRGGPCTCGVSVVQTESLRDGEVINAGYLLRECRWSPKALHWR